MEKLVGESVEDWKGPKRWKYSYGVGAIEEDYPWEIRWEVGFSEPSRTSVCKHCLRKKDYFVCPRVVVAFNEAGHSSTKVCLDCILGAAEAFKVEEEEEIVK